MNRRQRSPRAWIGGVCVAMVATVQAQQPWCMLDDPAWFRAHLAEMIEGGATDLAELECPVPRESQVLPEEIVMPMPCDRRMVFRRVVIGAEHVLDQEKVYLGRLPEDGEDSSESAYNGPNESALAGGFTVAQGKRDPATPPDLSDIRGRAYYLGKYEVTVPQYRLFESGLLATASGVDSCGEYNAIIAGENESTVRPVGGVTWYDAVAFSRALNQWLIAADAKRRDEGKSPFLPWEQGSTSYVRLPSEVEWEYAARGGIGTAESQGEANYKIRDPASGDVRTGDIYEISSGDDGGLGDDALVPVGLYLPNLLGMFDMVGNAEEIMFEPYRMTRPQRDLHGQVGGYIVKGGLPGSVERLGVGQRREVPFFTADGELRAPTVGFRLALSVPVRVDGQTSGAPWRGGLFNASLDEAITRAIAQARAADGGAAANTALEDELQRLRSEAERGEISQTALQNKLQALQTKLEQSNAILQERERDVLRGQVRSAVLGANSVTVQSRDILGRLLLAKRPIDALKKAGKALSGEELRRVQRKLQDILKKTRANVLKQESALDASADYYFDLISELTRKDPRQVSEAIRFVSDQFAKREVTALKNYVDHVSDNLSDARSSNSSVTPNLKTKWRKQLDKFSEKRAKLLKELET